MAELTELKFPEKLPGLTFYDGDEWMGGLDWLVSGTPGRTYSFSDVRLINMGDYFSAEEIGNPAIPKRYADCVTLLNNTKIKIGMKFQDEYNFAVSAELFDTDGETWIQDLNSFVIFGTYGFLNQYTGYYIYLFISTRYTTVPTEGVTSPDQFGIYAMTFNNQAGPYLSSYIASGAEVSTLTIHDKAVEEDGNNPNITVQNSAILTFTSVAGYTTWLRSFGDPFNDPLFPQDTPAGGGDPSGPGGGGGTYDDSSDPIDFPSLPTGGALTSGMIKGFVVGSANLQAMQQTLWNMSIFDISTQFQKLVNEPLQCMISLAALPVTPANTGTLENIKLGSFDTQAQGYRITGQYEVVDCGSLNLKEYWGSALDYAPYTDIDIFLPFIGIRTIRIEDAQALTLLVKYYVDVLTGSCIAFVKCGQSVLYSFTGNCLQHIPVTSQSSDLLKNTISAAGALGVGLATGNPAAAASGAAYGAINTATSKNHVQRSGDLAGSAGILGEYTPYVIIHRPIQSLAKGYNQFKGYPCNVTYSLTNLRGYTEVEHVHLTGISGATDTELREIEELLKSGVIL